MQDNARGIDLVTSILRTFVNAQIARQEGGPVVEECGDNWTFIDEDALKYEDEPVFTWQCNMPEGHDPKLHATVRAIPTYDGEAGLTLVGSVAAIWGDGEKFRA